MALGEREWRSHIPRMSTDVAGRRFKILTSHSYPSVLIATLWLSPYFQERSLWIAAEWPRVGSSRRDRQVQLQGLGS